MAVSQEKGSEALRQRLQRASSPYLSDARAELELEKLAGEISRQPAEEDLLHAQVELAHAEAKSLDAARFRADVLLMVFLLLLNLVLALAVVNPHALEVVGGALPWIPVGAT
jgi:hypothetical protein